MRATAHASRRRRPRAAQQPGDAQRRGRRRAPPPTSTARAKATSIRRSPPASAPIARCSAPTPGRPAIERDRRSVRRSRSRTPCSISVAAPGSIDVARQTAIAADLTHNSTVENTILQVETAAFSYLSTRAQRDAARSHGRSGDAALDAANERHRVGLATIADVLQAQTARSQAELQLRDARGLAARHARRARRRDGTSREHVVRDSGYSGDRFGALRRAVGRFVDRAGGAQSSGARDGARAGGGGVVADQGRTIGGTCRR